MIFRSGIETRELEKKLGKGFQTLVAYRNRN